MHRSTTQGKRISSGATRGSPTTHGCRGPRDQSGDTAALECRASRSRDGDGARARSVSTQNDVGDGRDLSVLDVLWHVRQHGRDLHILEIEAPDVPVPFRFTSRATGRGSSDASVAAEGPSSADVDASPYTLSDKNSTSTSAALTRDPAGRRAMNDCACGEEQLTVTKNSFPSSLWMPSIRHGRLSRCVEGDGGRQATQRYYDNAQPMPSTSTMLGFGIVLVVLQEDVVRPTSVRINQITGAYAEEWISGLSLPAWENVSYALGGGSKDDAMDG
ncbi:hypothetical protein B0H19DRAFT_1058914 [Mycena capillaripes]|nr:hypothetical protein B0H19DRAFT_1058914 [Mycena capillaripes]